jgi:uncharacterized membrane-anchored protein YhcB (DUF1043 family)
MKTEDILPSLIGLVVGIWIALVMVGLATDRNTREIKSISERISQIEIEIERIEKDEH